MIVALIGYGYWGKKIYRVLVNEFKLKVVLVEKKLIKNKSLHTISFEQLLVSQNIKYCFIATPEETHFTLAQACLRAKKNIFVEKPLVLTTGQIEQLIKLAKQHQLKLMVDYIFNFDPHFNFIKQFLKENQQLDKIFQVISRRFTKPSNNQKNILLDLAIHDVYLLDQLWPEKICKPKFRIPLFKIGEAKLQFFSKQCQYCCHYSYLAKPLRELRINTQKFVINWIKNSSGQELIKINKQIIPDSKLQNDKPSSLKKIIDYFLNSHSCFLAKNFYNYQQHTKLLEKILHASNYTI